MTYKDKASYDSTPPCTAHLAPRAPTPALACLRLGTQSNTRDMTHTVIWGGYG